MARLRILLQITIFLSMLSVLVQAAAEEMNSKKLDESPPDTDNKCGNCPCNNPCSSPPPPASPPPPPKNPPPRNYCPPPPRTPSPPYIYINGPPGNLYPIYPYYSGGGGSFPLGMIPLFSIGASTLWLLAF